MDVLSLANRIPSMIFGTKSDDDFSDRLNYRYTVALLILFSIIITTRQFGSENIKCWVPAHFTSNYEQYAAQICWISNTYYNDPNEHIPKEERERRQNEIKYYQWVSFVLLFQAFLFYLPRIFWRTASTRSGLDICDLVEAAHNYKAADKFDNRHKYMNYLVTNIDQFVDDPRRYDDNRTGVLAKRILMASIPCAGRFLGNYIVILYFLVKFVYIINTGIQVWIISAILGRSFVDFGLEFLKKIIAGQGWVIESRYFPKVTLCDFYIRELGHPNKSHRYTVQCVLPINLFNQQIFIIIWFWYLLVFCWNVGELIKWMIRVLPWKSSRWITQRISLFNKEVTKRKPPSEKLKHFIEKYLEPDGLFMIRMIANNTSDFVATDLICELWKKHYEAYEDSFRSSEPQDKDGVEVPPNSFPRAQVVSYDPDTHNIDSVDNFPNNNKYPPPNNTRSNTGDYDTNMTPFQSRITSINEESSPFVPQQQQQQQQSTYSVNENAPNYNTSAHIIRKRDNNATGSGSTKV